MTMTAKATEPLMMLKDLLLLDSSSDKRAPQYLSSAGAGAALPRSRSKKLVALRLLPRTLSKILKKSFSITHCASRKITYAEFAPEKKREVKVRDIVRFGSFLDRHPYPSPTVSSCGSTNSWPSSESSYDTDSAGSPPASFYYGESDNFSPPATPKPIVPLESKVIQNDKEEQLSPVSVMDFPCDGVEYEEENKMQATVQLNTHQELLIPMELEFDDCDDKGKMIDGRVGEMLKELDNAEGFHGLLLDLLVERLHGSTQRDGLEEDAVLVKEVSEWMSGRRRPTVEEDNGGEMYIEEMERFGRRWTRFDDEVEAVAAEVGDAVLVSMLKELVLDIHLLYDEVKL